MESARRATLDDLDDLDRLTVEALDEQRDQRGGELLLRRDSRPRPTRGWMTEAIGDPSQIVLVGCLDAGTGLDTPGPEGVGPTVVVGYAVARVEELRDGGLLAVVDELFVEPEARGVAVGEALMDELLAWATAAGCFGIDARALPGNRETKNFFERYGLTARALVVHRRLAGTSE